MLHHAKLSIDFWAEACNTAIYLHNRSPTAALDNETPFERLFRRKPNVTHLRVFGCVCYVYIPTGQRKKLDAKARRGIFVGYPPGVKGYKIYDVEKKYFVVSRNVHFIENNFEHFKKSESDSMEYAILDKYLSSNFEENEDVPELPVYAENVEPVGENNEEPMGAQAPRQRTFEDNFMEQVRNLGATREHRPPVRFREELCNITGSLTSEVEEPKMVEDALSSEQSQHWQEAMNSEFSSLMKNDTWELVPPPEDKNIVGSKWVFKVKRDANGRVDRYKARLVAQGYSQMKGVDYEEVFSPVTRNSSLRSLLALANAYNLDVHQMDVKTAFLNGTLDCDIYMEQPYGFVDKKKPDYVCKLKKSLYGLRQSARCWNTTLDDYLTSVNYRKGNADGCIYVKTEKEHDGQINFIILGVYVDDIVVVSNNTAMLETEKKKLSARFEMADHSEIHYLLVMLIKRDRDTKTLTMSQQTYLEGVLKRFGLENSKPIATPLEPGSKFRQSTDDEELFDSQTYQQAIGCLTYASTSTRPDISAAVNVLSQFSSKPSKQHWMGVKRIMRYLKGTIDYGLQYTVGEEDPELVGYSDADWAGDPDTRRSTSGYLFQFGGGSISWSSKKQCILHWILHFLIVRILYIFFYDRFEISA